MPAIPESVLPDWDIEVNGPIEPGPIGLGTPHERTQCVTTSVVEPTVARFLKPDVADTIRTSLCGRWQCRRRGFGHGVGLRYASPHKDEACQHDDRGDGIGQCGGIIRPIVCTKGEKAPVPSQRVVAVWPQGGDLMARRLFFSRY
jgi:hypothetical protein